MLRETFLTVFYACGVVVIPLASLALIKGVIRYLRCKPSIDQGTPVEAITGAWDRLKAAEDQDEDGPSVSKVSQMPSMPVSSEKQAVVESSAEAPVECGNCGKIIKSKSIGQTKKLSDLEILNVYKCEHCGARVAA